MKMKKTVVWLLVSAMTFGCLTGCGGGKASNDAGAKDNTTKDITISIWNSGIGVKWLEAVIEGFEKEHPEYNVTYTASASQDAVVATYGMADIDTFDLYMTYCEADPEYMEPLDDVLESTIEGEGKTIKEKFNPNYLEIAQAEDGHYYALSSSGGVYGFVYNKELFEAAGIKQLPRTTDEMIVVCDSLYSAGTTPLCHFRDGGYYSCLLDAFVAQYDGMDYLMNNLYGCTDEDGVSPSKKVFTKQDGRYFALQFFEKLITPEYTLTGSNSQSHTDIQTEFLTGKSAMMFNGSWLVNEMKNSSDSDFSKLGLIRTPVLSEIIKKLSTVKTDIQLRKVVSAVDQILDGEKELEDFASGDGYKVEDLTVSKEDWNIIWAARNVLATNYGGEAAFIPNYSVAKEGAKEFLKYMYSDEGYEIFVKESRCPRPMTLSTGEQPSLEGFSDFEKTQFSLVTKAESFASRYVFNRHEIFKTGGAEILATEGAPYISMLCANNSADRKTAEEIWNSYLALVEDMYDVSWIKNMKK